MRNLNLLIIIFLTVFSFISEARVSVKGYFRKNGTYVAPHYRSSPDGNFYNNWSTKGNINPYTGKEGTKNYPSSLNGLGNAYPSGSENSTKSDDGEKSTLTSSPNSPEASSEAEDSTSISTTENTEKNQTVPDSFQEKNPSVTELTEQIRDLKMRIQNLEELIGIIRKTSKEENVPIVNEDIQPIFSPKPSYSREERRRGLQGECAFLLFIDNNGVPTNFKLLKSTGHRELDKKTLAALRLWRYPQGKSGWVEQPLRWVLTGINYDSAGTFRRENPSVHKSKENLDRSNAVIESNSIRNAFYETKSCRRGRPCAPFERPSF